MLSGREPAAEEVGDRRGGESASVGGGGVVQEEDGSGCTERWMDMPGWAVETVCLL